MRICIVVDNLNPQAGWGRLALKLGEEFEQRGIDVSFVTQFSSLSKRNILITPLRNFSWKSPLKPLITILRIRKFIVSCDTVLCFDANPYGVLVAFSILGKKNNFVLYAIGSYSLLTQNFFRNILIRFAYHQASRVIVVSEFVKKQIENSGLLSVRMEIVPVGVDLKNFFPTRIRPKSVFGRYIIGVGALKYRKGFHLSIAAFAAIASDFSDLNFVIVGHREDNDYVHSLDSLVAKLGMQKRVIFLSNVTDEELRSLYSFADFFLLTPITESNAIEGFGMVYLEAASCGITAIGTVGTGAQEAIISGVTGILAIPEIEDIAAQIRVLEANRNYRDNLSLKAQERSASYSWDVVADKLLKSLL